MPPPARLRRACLPQMRLRPAVRTVRDGTSGAGCARMGEAPGGVVAVMHPARNMMETSKAHATWARGERPGTRPWRTLRAVVLMGR